MPGQRNEDTPLQEERTKRHERAQRILDAAAELIQRWGYNKTTVDDIARRAGVAKGTIYLHWKTREDLFRALMKREEVALAEDIRQRIASDPEGSTLHGVVKHSMLATIKRPIWKAVLLGDTEMLGEFGRREYADVANQERLEAFKAYLEFLRSHGLIRTDLSFKEQMYLISAISIGFLLVEPLLPDELKLSDEEAAEMMAETIRRTFERRDAPTSNELEEISRVFNQYFERDVEILREQSRKEME